MDSPRPTVVIAGANGFVGRALCTRLRERFDVIGLSRSERAELGVPVRRCDLLSAEDARAALAGAELAVYLVHAMMPSDRLMQGSFDDVDLLVADNFGRAAAAAGVRQIVYLGGLAPTDGEASRHITSRLEVERALGAYGVPVTTLRAGLVFGPGGSSTRIVFNLARRLPVMVCPRWTDTPTQPIALDDATALIGWVLGRAEAFGETYDVGGPEVMTYRALMELVGEAMVGRKPWALTVPVLTPELSRLWVSLVTGAPKELVAPLIGSLSHPMVARDRRLQEEAQVPGRSMRDVLPEAIAADADAGTPRAFRGTARPSDGAPRVRSIQRFARPPGARASDVAEAYFSWLGRTPGPFAQVSRRDDGGWRLGVAGLEAPLLELTPRGEASADRVVFGITGGLLATGRGEFEFREVLGGEAILVAIADYEPRLPWWLYLVSQAPAYAAVMALFRRHLPGRGDGVAATA